MVYNGNSAFDKNIPYACALGEPLVHISVQIGFGYCVNNDK